jgi:hypothetical protein
MSERETDALCLVRQSISLVDAEAGAPAQNIAKDEAAGPRILTLQPAVLETSA